MSCREAMAELSAVADGELGPGRAGTLEAHLAGCPACTAFQARLVALRRQLRFEPVGAVPDVAPRVLETIRSSELRQGGVDSRRTAVSPWSRLHQGGVDSRRTAVTRWARLPLRGASQRRDGFPHARSAQLGLRPGRRRRLLPSSPPPGRTDQVAVPCLPAPRQGKYHRLLLGSGVVDPGAG